MDMTQACRVCNHPKMQEIDRQLVKGHNKARLSRQYEVSEDSLAYHQKHHLSRQLQVGAEVALKNQGVDVFNELDNLIVRTKKILEQAETNGHSNVALKAIQQLRGNFTLVAQLQAEIARQKLADLNIAPEDYEEFLEWRTRRWTLEETQNLETLTDEERDFLFSISQKQLTTDQSQKVKRRRTT